MCRIQTIFISCFLILNCIISQFKNAIIVAQFADKSTDTKLIHRKLQLHLNRAERWCHRWRISINPEKSASVLFLKDASSQDTPLPLVLKPIQWRDKMQYHGVTLDREMHFCHHIEDTISKVHQTLGMLLSLIGYHFKVHTK